MNRSRIFLNQGAFAFAQVDRSLSLTTTKEEGSIEPLSRFHG